MNTKPEPKLKGALLTFIVLQLIYLFFFFAQFPESFRNALMEHSSILDGLASWLSTLTMLSYCVVCLVSVAQFVMRRPVFLLYFQISGAIALAGNFLVFVLRQVDARLGFHYYEAGDYYWVLFIMALFWAVIWCMYFARSSRVFSYMGEDPAYLQKAVFTKNVRPPAPWVEPPPYQAYQPSQAYQAPRPASPPPQPGYPGHQGAPYAPPPQGGQPPRPPSYPPAAGGQPQGQPPYTPPPAPQPQAGQPPQANQQPWQGGQPPNQP